MNYPKTARLYPLVTQLELYAQLQHEYGARGIARELAKAGQALVQARRRIQKLRPDPRQARREPNDLPGIRRLRPSGPRRLWIGFDPVQYREKLEGALLARMAGCTLGAPMEGSPVERMELLAKENGESFPPVDYWRYVPQPYRVRYDVSRNEEYTRDKLKEVPVDDDVVFTILGLLIAERFGLDFTVTQVGQAWRKWLPIACTAEGVALNNLKRGVPAVRAGAVNNPYCEWIGADIRADPWGYIAAGWPERAAAMAYRDAYLSHRRQGIYGAMYFAAAIAAAFHVSHPVEALEIGLTEIPRDCLLARHIRWALSVAPQIRNYRDARAAVDERFRGMHEVHTINNACLTVWGLTLGGTDMTKVISETVAMGLDNDCTAATAGSIVGAIIGKKRIPAHWYKPFHNTVRSYLNGYPRFRIDDLVRRFTRQAAGARSTDPKHPSGERSSPRRR